MKRLLLIRSRLLLFTTLMLISSLSLYSQTPSGNWIDYASAFPGSGTKDSPYEIQNATHLAYLAKEVAQGKTYSGSYFKLTNPIDLSEHFWTPIGYGALYNGDGEYFPFKGFFDGDNYAISNLQIAGNELGEKHYHTGIFGVIGDGCQLKNMTLIQPVVNGKDNEQTSGTSFIATAALAGLVYMENGKVQLDNCRVEEPRITGGASIKNPSLSETSYTGALIGECLDFYSNTTSHLEIKNCRIEGGKVTGGEATYSSVTGGLIGRIFVEGSIIENCMNSSSVTGGKSSMQYTGGLIGLYFASGELKKSFNEGNVEGGSDNANYVGGVMGYINGSKKLETTMTKVFNTGRITVNDHGNFNDIGGIAGSAAIQNAASITLKNCYNTSVIKSYNNNKNIIGGLYGTIYIAANATGFFKMEDSYIAGKIDGSFSTAGGVVGKMYAGEGYSVEPELTNCLAVLEVTNTSSTIGRIVGNHEVGTLSGNYARVLGKSSLGTTADSNDGADWVEPLPGNWEMPINQWGVDWDAATPTLLLPKLANLSNQPDISYSFKGEGTEESPYLICTPEELKRLAIHVNEWENSYKGKYFALEPEAGNVLDLTENTELTPIGHTGNTSRKFEGIFDGKGNTITNLSLDANQLDDKFQQSIALFGNLATGATVKNLTLDKPVIKGKALQNNSLSLGTLVAYTDSSSIENCHATEVTIQSENGEKHNVFTGGLIGEVGKKINLTNSTVKVGNIQAPSGFNFSFTGGLIGYLSNTQNSTRITNCNTQDLTIIGGNSSYDSYTGGTIGFLYSSVPHELKNNTVTNVTITGGDADFSPSGGAIGYIQGDLQMEGFTVKNSKITGGNAWETQTAGLVGFINSSSEAHITGAACINTVIQGAEATGFACTGGLIGYIYKGSLTKSYVQNTTVITSPAADTYSGGLIGYINVDDEGEKFLLSQCFAEGTIQAADIQGTDNTSITLGGLAGMFWAPTNGTDTLLKTAIIEDSYSYTILISSNNTNGENIRIGGISGQVTNSGVPNQQGLSDIQVKNCFAAGEIREINSNAKYVYTGGIAGLNQNSEIKNNLVMLNRISTGQDIHRIIGKNFQNTEAEGFVDGNYAFIPEYAVTQETGHDKPHGEHWTGLMAENPINGWSNTTWNIDQTDYLLPKLAGLPNQPDIRNLVFNDMEEATIQTIPNQIHTGKPIEPTLSVTHNGKTLIKDTDYTVHYTNNINIGTATASITGIGEYRGTLSRNFRIVHATYYVTIPAKEGAITDPLPGRHPVTDGEPFTLTLTLEEGYDESIPVVKTNGNVLNSGSAQSPVYIYIIDEVTENITVTIDIEPNIPISNEEVKDSQNKVYSQSGNLCIETIQNSAISVYTINGILTKQIQATSGSVRIPLDKGIYIVRINKEVHKVVIN